MSASHPSTTTGNVYRIASLLALAILWVGSLAARPARAQGTGSSKFHVDSQRLQGTLEKLSEFGRNPEGGVTRIGFSETDMAAREYVIGLMKEADLKVRVDPAGNIFGRRAGSEKLPILLFGSHIDSVLHGGNFDGDVGSMGSIEVMRALNDAKVKTRHPLEVVIWTNEEGNHFALGTLGSGVAAGLLGPEILGRKDDQGLTLADCCAVTVRIRLILLTHAFPKECWQPLSNCTSNRAHTLMKQKSPSGSYRGSWASRERIASSRVSPITRAPRR